MCIPGTVLGAVVMLIHSIFTTALWSRLTAAGVWQVALHMVIQGLPSGGSIISQDFIVPSGTLS